MRGDAGMQSADEIVEDLLITAKLFVMALEAVFAVDQLPDRDSVVIGEAFNVVVQIEVLAFVIVLVLHVPHPPRSNPPLRTP